jgi:hypothetical protein
MQPRTQLRLRLERPPASSQLTPDSRDLLEALADLLLAALDPTELKSSGKESGDES